jgi:hypothetical protein
MFAAASQNVRERTEPATRCADNPVIDPVARSHIASRRHHRIPEEKRMSIGMILLIVLVLALVGAFPSWPHSRSWGYGPSGGLGLVVVILLVLLLLGRI